MAFALLRSVWSAASPAHRGPTCNPAQPWRHPAAFRFHWASVLSGHGVRLSGQKPKHPASALITPLLAGHRSMALSYGFLSAVFGLFVAAVQPPIPFSQPAGPSMPARLGVPPRLDHGYPAAGTVRARGRAASGYAALRSAVSQAGHQNPIKKPASSGPACQPSDCPCASLTQSLAGCAKSWRIPTRRSPCATHPLPRCGRSLTRFTGIPSNRPL